ncbi:MAG: GNAT family N-acetyltransferase [Actinobacteria bacterium]|nr:GNAT family N-acetyltransferase [Actinomycetota bacterium]
MVRATSLVTAIAALCAEAAADAPSADELAWVLTAAEPRATVVGDPDVGIAAVALHPEGAYLRLLAVHPRARRRGHGRELLAEAEAVARAGGAPWLQVGAEAPWYLWPGVDTAELGLLCLLERARYTRVDSAWNMGVALAGLPHDPGGWRVARGTDRDAIDAWTQAHWVHWGAEMLRALALGRLVVTSDDDGIAAACAYGVCRDRYVGPVAVRPDLLGRGSGQAALLGALHRMRAEGHKHAEISWVGPICPYVRVGATIDRILSIQRKDLTVSRG